ncbi:MAG: MFS transporter [Kiritimatiellaceae bacterium TMED266]|nr:MAG: MFS transporter [Kiritimatiellaceae bacterium TMED266]
MSSTRYQHRLWLFVASCISLLTTSMIFAIRGDISGALSAEFHLSAEMMGKIWAPAFLGFTFSIFVCGVAVDWLGMRVMHILSSILFLAGLGCILVAPAPVVADGELVAGIFATPGTTLLYVGFLIMGIAQGIVEGVINPLIATVYPDKKGKMLNILHAWWPGGMIVGGLLALGLTQLDAVWQVKMGTIAVPAVIYLIMCILRPYPQTERVAAAVSFGDMVKGTLKPLYLLLFALMWLTAAVELGPDQWFPAMMKELTGMEGIIFLCYTAGLMFFIRYFGSELVHRFSPFLVLIGCSILTFVGLFWLGSLSAGASTGIAFLAATIFGVGKSFFWPTMLGIVAERFPKGGALALNVMGGAGMASIAFVLPVMGGQLDSAGAGAAFKSISYLALIVLAVFVAIHIGFKLRGGYRAVDVNEDQ